MIHLTTDDLDQMEKRTRVQLATSLPGVKPISLIGTADRSGHTNLAPFSSIVHLGSNPVLIGMVTRPDVVERHTLANLVEQGCWTINHLTEAIYEQGHHCAARYPAEVSEFDASGLTAAYLPDFAAPFVAESPFRLGLELEELIDIPSNGTKLIVGRVQHVQIEEASLADDGSVDLAGLRLVASTALDTYFGIQRMGRLAYAKPKA